MTSFIFLSFIPSTDIICDIFEWLQVHFMSPKLIPIGHMYAFVQKFHSTTSWACPIFARPLIKCATFYSSTQNDMNKFSRWCRWECSWAFLHKIVMQYTQYMYICVIILTVLNVISTTTCVYFNTTQCDIQLGFFLTELCLHTPPQWPS